MRTIASVVVLSMATLTTSTVNAEVDPVLEREYGQFRDQLVLASEIIVLDEMLNRRIDEIGQRVAAGCPREDLSYTFRIVSDPSINAYATTGGFVYVNTGLLDVAQGEDELAAILAHEVAHACGSHLIKEIRSTKRKRILFMVGGVVVGQVVGFELAEAVGNAGANSAQQAFELGQQLGELSSSLVAQKAISRYSKSQELDADREAIAYILAADYDPYAMPRFFKRLQTMGDTFQLDIEYASPLIDAEPGLAERIENLEQLLKELGNGSE